MYVYNQQLYNTRKAYTTQGSVYREKQQQQNFAGLRVELQAAPCLPCSKLGVKRGHCATIPLSLSIAAVEAEYILVAIEAGEATVEAALLLLLLYSFFLLYTSYEKQLRGHGLYFFVHFQQKKGVYMMMILMRPPRPFFGLLRLCFSYPRQPDSIISKVGLVLGFSAHSVGCSSLNLFFVVST